jgi:hypothetical protein
MNFSTVGASRPVRRLLPAGVETSVGLDAVELAKLAGLILDEWQAWFLRESLKVGQDGRWSAFEAGLIVPRQNGKGSLLEARQVAGLFLLEEPLGVHSAHEFKTSYEHFLRITSLIEGCADLDRKVMRIRRGAGEQAVELKNGCRLRFLARSTGSGRGLTGDTVYLDEAFALTTAQMGAMLPTLSAVPNPQVWYTSSAPRETSEVLHALRRRGREGAPDGRLLYAEWGLDKGVDLEDRANWRLTNPALGIRIDEEFVEAELAAMRAMPDEFGRERLGIADDPLDVQEVIPNWLELADAASVIAANHCIALDVSPDRRWSAFAGAGRRSDGLLHVEAWEHRPGTDWVLDVAVKSWRLLRVPIRIQSGSPAASFIAPLTGAGVKVVEVTTGDYARATGQLLDAATAQAVRHPGGNALNAAVRGAVLRETGDVVSWGRRTSRVDITTLVAATLAAGGVPAFQPPPGLFVAVT